MALPRTPDNDALVEVPVAFARTSNSTAAIVPGSRDSGAASGSPGTTPDK
jgi:hypothetical protein